MHALRSARVRESRVLSWVFPVHNRYLSADHGRWSIMVDGVGTTHAGQLRVALRIGRSRR